MLSSGSRYHGLQFNAVHNVPTVEQALEEALFKSGMISESNHGQPKKVGWSRSSRTDKGVHAARVVIGVKLLLDPSCVDQTSGHVPLLSGIVNQHLPADIRVFSCRKMFSSFRARAASNWR